MRKSGQRVETFEAWRGAHAGGDQPVIEWGLKHPEKVSWIPVHPVGRGRFSERLKGVFWSMVLEKEQGPEEEAN